jgi:hypothetical protein
MARTAATEAGDWSMIEQWARRAAGGLLGGITGGIVGILGAGGTVPYTRALQQAADTIALRGQAMYWLAQPATRHREGLLAIAEYARRARISASARAAAAAAAARAAAASARARASGVVRGAMRVGVPAANGIGSYYQS